MERVHQVCFSIPGDRFTGLSTGRDIPFAAADSTLREPCRDLIEPTDTNGWLARTAGTIPPDQGYRGCAATVRSRSLNLRSQIHAKEWFAASGELPSLS